MFSFFKSLFDSNEKQIKKISPVIAQINDLSEYASGLSDEQLLAKTSEFRKKLNIDLTKTGRHDDFNHEKQKKELFEILPEAFAIVREAAHRVANHRHFEVQLMAGYFLADNKISELFTGEGKTNSATLALYLYGLTGRGAHLVTVNDYLARRDGEWNGHVLSSLGLSVGIINSGTQYKFVSDKEAIEIKGEEAKTQIAEREKKAKEVGRLKLDLMNGVNLVEVSKKEAYECDVLFGTNNEYGFDYLRDNMAQKSADQVQRRLHFAIVDEADSILIDEARTPLIISQAAEASNDMYKKFSQIVKLLNKDSDYTVDEKANSVSVSDDGIDKVEKALGVKNVYEDPQYAYHLDNALKAKELYVKDDEYIIRNGEIVIVDEFTGRAMDGRRYSEGLHQAIEAKEGVEVKRESKTLATITLQNYFRLYDYLSGMTATALTEAEELAKIYNLDVIVVPTNKNVVRKDLNDNVFRTELGKFEAIVEEIEKRHASGQPILVGTASVDKSEYLSSLLLKRGIKHEVLNAKQHEKEAEIVQHAGEKGRVTISTNMAGRGTDIALAEGVKELGGLYVIGTERHESRRIDNQLRGRSGRQGDPGESVFYVSFQDELMRKFGGDRMNAVLSRVGMEDNMPISLGILGKTIENAQKKVEAHNFDIRKRLVEYDDVLNQQRDIVYSLRAKILTAEKGIDGLVGDLGEINLKKIKDVSINALHEGLSRFTLKDSSTWSVDEAEDFGELKYPLNLWILKRIFDYARNLLTAQLSDDMKVSGAEEKSIFAQIEALVTEERFKESVELLGYSDLPEFYRHFDKEKNLGEKEDLLLKVVMTAFVKHLSEVSPVAASRELAKVLILQAIDKYWMEHLDAMADLREGIGMRSIAQRDPLVEYKNESFKLFENLFRSIDEAVVKRYYKVKVLVREEVDLDKINTEHQELNNLPQRNDALSAVMQAGKALKAGREDSRPGNVGARKALKNDYSKIGRNDECPCGSGKKYKKCHIDREPKGKEEVDAFRLYFSNKNDWLKKYGSK